MMKYTQLGNSGLVVSRLSFGAMTFGEGQLVPGVTNRIGQNQANEMVAKVLDAGVNLFVLLMLILADSQKLFWVKPCQKKEKML